MSISLECLNLRSLASWAFFSFGSFLIVETTGLNDRSIGGRRVCWLCNSSGIFVNMGPRVTATFDSAKINSSEIKSIGMGSVTFESVVGGEAVREAVERETVEEEALVVVLS